MKLGFPPLQGLNTNHHSVHSASHYAIANALSEQQVSNTYDFNPCQQREYLMPQNRRLFRFNINQIRFIIPGNYETIFRYFFNDSQIPFTTRIMHPKRIVLVITIVNFTITIVYKIISIDFYFIEIDFSGRFPFTVTVSNI